MNIAVKEHEHIAIIQLEGDFMGADVQAFECEVREHIDREVRDFVIDLTDVEFLDSKALGALLWAQEKCTELLGQIRLVGLQENVLAILRLTRLDSRFDTHGSVDSALASLRI